ncbi:MAG: mechanosensitive ion channel [Candidatus Aenigmarchaeota archaeon]|nr:mechanosensitive ion channel [Candidatus Aenigmarchaeota archaeon]
MDLNSLGQSLWAWIADFSSKLLPEYILPNLWLIFEVVFILVIAYIVGRFGKFVTKRLLSMVGLKRMTAKSWAENVLKITGYKGSVVELIGDLVKWLIYILFFTFILQTLGLSGVADVFGQIANFVPRSIGAILLMVIGFIIADFFGKVFGEAGFRMLQDQDLGKFVGGLVRYTIGMVVLIMSLALIGLDIAALSILLAALLVTIIMITAISLKDILPEITSGIQVKSRLKAGDRVKVDGYSGVVESIRPLVTMLNSGKSVIIMPNSILTKNPVEKQNRK